MFYNKTSLLFYSAQESNPIIAVNAKEFAAIMKIFIILSDLIKKTTCISFNASCAQFKRKLKTIIKFAAQIAGKDIAFSSSSYKEEEIKKS